MTFKVNADCTALSSDEKTTIFLKKNETLDTKDFYLPSLLAIATNGRSHINKKGETIVEYSSSIDLDVDVLNLTNFSQNSFVEERKNSKKNEVNQVK